MLSVLQSLAVPALFLLCLNIYSMPSNQKSSFIMTNNDLLYRMPDWWEVALTWASPVFAIFEAM